ncbi:peptidase [Streptomyces chryseus]|uniref:Peptidase n=1 Tax=Streptomyces chryseus TaxID=68186 RepID=A0ABQ3DSD1_9ACTN|nr:peptidase [Streptomyces chryseus]GGX17657.1 peptidase [Streptomyces chryseus]GHB12878.1 peptidase [Streptomyces chryseus]
MQSPTPWVPHQPAPQRADIELRLTAELASVVAGARRRALRDGDRQIDTAHLLHSVLEAEPEVRAAFDGGPAQVARVLGYLVQRSIGYGLRWQGAEEASGGGAGAPASPGTPVIPAGPVVPAADGGSAVRSTAALPGWSRAAVTAMEGALGRASARGDERAGGLDLLAVLASDPACRAVEVLRRGGVDTELLAGRLHVPSRQVSQG